MYTHTRTHAHTHTHTHTHTFTSVCQVSEWPQRDAELRLETVADLYKRHAQADLLYMPAAMYDCYIYDCCYI